MMGMKRSTEAVVSIMITANANVILVAPHRTAVAPKMLKNAGVIGSSIYQKISCLTIMRL